MPSTRRRRTRASKKPDIHQWQLDHILTGQDPEPETMETISWNRQRIHETWERIKDDPFVLQWKAQHGLTFYEQEYQE